MRVLSLPTTHRLASSSLPSAQSCLFRRRRCVSSGVVQRITSSNQYYATRKFSTAKQQQQQSWWTNAELWGQLSAAAGWTMSIAAIYDSTSQGPEVIPLSMTSVLVVYSSLFFRWAFVVKPQNLFLAACHFTNVCAQLNQGAFDDHPRRMVGYYSLTS
jgi:hypothetical protein